MLPARHLVLAGARDMTFQELEAELRSVFYSGDAERVRYVNALASVSRFLEDNGVSPAIAGEFQVLAAALSDLETGTVASCLQARALNRPIDPTEIWIARALVAIAIDLVAGSTGSVRDASRFAASEAAKWGHLLCPKNFDDNARDWHKQFAARRVKRVEAQSVFDSRKELLTAEISDAERNGIAVTAESIGSVIMMYAAQRAIRANNIPDDEARRLLGLNAPSLGVGEKPAP